MAANQADRTLSVSSPLGPDVLLFRSMTASDQLSQPFRFDLEVLSEDFNIKLDDLVGQSVTVRYDGLDGGKTRYFNGWVSRFSFIGQASEDRYARYHIELRPWLWFLTRSVDSRIFQEMTVEDIIKQVFSDRGLSDVKFQLSGSYRTWEYCVQYRESDFNFVTRLMEQEGMYYYCTHDDGLHTLVVTDDIAGHEPCPGYEELPFFPPGMSERRERDHVSEWSVTQNARTAKYELRDFDFKAPNPQDRLKVVSTEQTPLPQTVANFEIYDYPGEYVTTGEGDSYAKVRLQEVQAEFERAQGGGNAGGLLVGGLWKLTNYPRDDQNQEYLMVSGVISLDSGSYEAGSDGAGPSCHCSFEVQASSRPYRAPRTTPKPFVQGPQTAIVTGPSGEEIHTDEHGRVKVQFHWDREGQTDENSSCWIRVSHPWAGKNWGAIAIPRIGQEVIVDFLEGDPDRPIITGRVYNGEAVPPYELPANMTQTGIKSRSSKEGTADNFNEIRFEDKKGEEQVYIHAEKNQDNIVENDETTSVGNNRTEDVGKDETITIGENRTENVGKNEKITIGENRTENVGKNESVSIGENRTKDVGKDETISIGANRTDDVSKNETISVGENRTETVGKKESVTIGDDREHSVGKDDSLSVGKSLLINAGDEILLKTGSASIHMKSDGSITIKGKDIDVKGSGKINAKASSNIIMKGSKILQN